MACKEITEESIKEMTDNDLGFLYEDCCDLGHPLRDACEKEILYRKVYPYEA